MPNQAEVDLAVLDDHATVPPPRRHLGFQNFPKLASAALREFGRQGRAFRIHPIAKRPAPLRPGCEDGKCQEEGCQGQDFASVFIAIQVISNLTTPLIAEENNLTTQNPSLEHTNPVFGVAGNQPFQINY